jgi:UDP-2-acetamido-3-amino-2,3-dideoxy-glucuronate N-acetyltransferase
MIDVGAFIHPLAHVSDGVELGHGVKVWQFASVIRGARIGAGSSIASCAVVDAARLGEGCIVGHGASVHPGTEIGAGVFIGPGAVVCNDAWPRSDKSGFEADRLISGALVTVRIEDGAGVGANAVILPGVTIGKGSFVAAGAVCDQSVPAGHLFKKSGQIVEINPGWTKRRMRAA